MIDKKTLLKQCTGFKHSFIVSGWSLSASKKTATSFVCQNCLILVDKVEIEVANRKHSDDIQKLLNKEPTV